MKRKYVSKAGGKMKVIWKIALLVLCILIVFYITDDRIQENEPLESPPKLGIPISGHQAERGREAGPERPKRGISIYVGEPAELLVQKYGEPNRREPSGYGYEWWIYTGTPHLMAGIENGNVNQIYSPDPVADVEPFQVGQSIEDIYRFTIIGSEVDVTIDSNVYTFTLNMEDMKNRLLVVYSGLYAQLYIDENDKELEGVRFIDPKTLVLHQPYEMTYAGEMITASPPTSNEQAEINRTAERQIFELTNRYRDKHRVSKVEHYFRLEEVAREHSKEMALQQYFSNESPTTGKLADRLKDAQIVYKKAGENIAFNYVDAIEAVHGWLNSEAHRGVLLDSEFTHLGVGVFGKYYTQNFVRLEADPTKQK